MAVNPFVRIALVLTLFSPLLLVKSDFAQSKSEKSDETAERALLHQSEEWTLVQAHLPDPQTATAAQLELRHPLLARAYFLRAASLQPKNAQVWNNVGASEFLAGDFLPALRDYNKAVKLEKRNAIYHSNLGTAYFESKDYESARRQFQAAYKLDPKLYQHRDGAGVEAHIFSSTNHGRFCFELARVSARGHDDAGVISWLTKASDSGFDIQAEMGPDRLFDIYRKDPRVRLIIQNAKSLRAAHTLATAPIPPLPDKLTPLSQ